jgi:hypothetical protein
LIPGDDPKSGARELRLSRALSRKAEGTTIHTL